MAVKTKRRRSALQKAWTNVVKTKARNCDGKAKVSDVRAAAKKYEDLAVKKGQKRSEARKKVNKVTQKACKR